MSKLRLLDLFSGIGGFSLGLERSGAFETVAFCEIDQFCRRVLAKHWPEVPQYDDVRSLTAARLAADGIAVDAICGGFPCQDISVAGKGAGLAGERSGLWKEYARLIGELRPRFVIVENVSALLGRGLGNVLGDLAALGYDAEWHCIPASAVGAPHRRDRVWIIASRREPWAEYITASDLADADNRYNDTERKICSGRFAFISRSKVMAYAYGQRELQPQGLEQEQRRWSGNGCEDVSDASSAGLALAWSQSSGADGEHGWGMPTASSWWATEPAVGRVAHGVPNRVDRLRSLGNAVVPQIPEMIGRAIAEALNV